MAGAKIESICCWICGRDVSLRDCKIDERGHAVHEDCYVVRMKLEAESAAPPAKRHVVDPCSPIRTGSSRTSL